MASSEWASGWGDFANTIAGIMKTERKLAIEECLLILRAHRLDTALMEKLMEEAKGRG